MSALKRIIIFSTCFVVLIAEGILVFLTKDPILYKIFPAILAVFSIILVIELAICIQIYKKEKNDASK